MEPGGVRLHVDHRNQLVNKAAPDIKWVSTSIQFDYTLTQRNCMPDVA
jgi:hypothetical protein